MSQLTPQFLAQKAWDLYQTHGVPFEVSEDILEQNELKLDQDFLNKLRWHSFRENKTYL